MLKVGIITSFDFGRSMSNPKGEPRLAAQLDVGQKPPYIPFIINNPQDIPAEAKEPVTRGGGNPARRLGLFSVNPQSEFCTYINLEVLQSVSRQAAASLEEDIAEAHALLDKLSTY